MSHPWLKCGNLHQGRQGRHQALCRRAWHARSDPEAVQAPQTLRSSTGSGMRDAISDHWDLCECNGLLATAWTDMELMLCAYKHMTHDDDDITTSHMT